MEKTHIWRVVFLSIALFLAGILGKPAISLDNPLWTEESAPRLQFQHYPESRDDPVEFEEGDSKEYRYEDQRYYKRGFSMLARWRPFNAIAKQRSSIRDANRHLIPKLDLVSAETRALSRPSGQPLRWG